MRIVILFLALSLIPVAVGRPASAGERTLVVGTDEWPPYEYATENGVSGIATDIVQTVLERMGVGVESLSQFPWVRGLRMLEGGELDVLYAGIYDQERLAYVRYHSEPLVSSRWVLFARKGMGAKSYESLNDLRGRTLGVVRGYSYTPEINDLLQDNKLVVEASTDEAILELLVRGRVDFALCDMLNCQYLSNRLGLDYTIQVVPGPPLSEITLYALFNRATISESFVKRFDKELRALKAENTYGDILRKHLYQ